MRSPSSTGTSLSSHPCGRCRSSIKIQILFGLTLAEALEKENKEFACNINEQPASELSCHGNFEFDCLPIYFLSKYHKRP